MGIFDEIGRALTGRIEHIHEFGDTSLDNSKELEALLAKIELQIRELVRESNYYTLNADQLGTSAGLRIGSKVYIDIAFLLLDEVIFQENRFCISPIAHYINRQLLIYKMCELENEFEHIERSYQKIYCYYKHKPYEEFLQFRVTLYTKLAE